MAEGEESLRSAAVLSWMKSYNAFAAAAAAAGLDDSHDDQTEISVVVVVEVEEAGLDLNKSLGAEDEKTTKRTPCYFLLFLLKFLICAKISVVGSRKTN